MCKVNLIIYGILSIHYWSEIPTPRKSLNRYYFLCCFFPHHTPWALIIYFLLKPLISAANRNFLLIHVCIYLFIPCDDGYYRYKCKKLCFIMIIISKQKPLITDLDSSFLPLYASPVDGSTHWLSRPNDKEAMIARLREIK